MAKVRIIKDEPMFSTRASLKTGMEFRLVKHKETPPGKVALKVFLGDIGYKECDRSEPDDWKVLFVDADLTSIV